MTQFCSDEIVEVRWLIAAGHYKFKHVICDPFLKNTVLFNLLLIFNFCPQIINDHGDLLISAETSFIILEQKFPRV